MGFGAKWRSWISFCLHSSSFLILVNGCLKEFFGESTGLRQGDPLSPFLFIMVSEVLRRMIKRAKMGFISGFKLGKEEGVTISHLQFVDDMMIFCDAEVRQVKMHFGMF